jgi:hypothetical protein
MKKKDLRSFQERLEEINQDVLKWSEKVNADLLKLNKDKEVLLDWDNWFKKGKDRICGVQLFYYLALYPDERKECVKMCVEWLREFWKEQDDIGSIKDAVSEVLAELITKQKAIGGAIRFGSMYFWARLDVLVREKFLTVLNIIPVNQKPDTIDEEGKVIEAINTLVKVGGSVVEKLECSEIGEEENDIIEAIDERLYLESLEENEKTVYKLHLDGYSEQKIEERTGINKSKVHRMIKTLKEKHEAWKKG